jgi:hypothetical protein
MNKKPFYENRDILEARLNLAGEKLRTITAGLNLSTPPAAFIREIKEAHLPANLERLVLFLIANNGSRTDTISASEAIGNVSDCYTKTKQKQQLRQLSLVINCEILPAVNRYGSLTTMGHLFIRPSSDNKLWHPKKSANDS